MRRTCGDEQLIRADHRATNPRGRRLGLVHGDQQGQGANAEASNETADHDLVPGGVGSDLDDETDGDNEAPEGDGWATADAVGDGGGDEGADEGSDGEQGDDEAGADDGEIGRPIGVSLSESFEDESPLSGLRSFDCVEGHAGLGEGDLTHRSRKSGISRKPEIWPVS